MKWYSGVCIHMALGLSLAVGTLAHAGPMEDADALFSSALKASRASSYEKALDAWLEAAELYTKAGHGA